MSLLHQGFYTIYFNINWFCMGITLRPIKIGFSSVASAIPSKVNIFAHKIFERCRLNYPHYVE